MTAAQQLVVPVVLRVAFGKLHHEVLPVLLVVQVDELCLDADRQNVVVPVEMRVPAVIVHVVLLQLGVVLRVHLVLLQVLEDLVVLGHPGAAALRLHLDVVRPVRLVLQVLEDLIVLAGGHAELEAKILLSCCGIVVP